MFFKVTYCIYLEALIYIQLHNIFIYLLRVCMFCLAMERVKYFQSEEMSL